MSARSFSNWQHYDQASVDLIRFFRVPDGPDPKSICRTEGEHGVRLYCAVENMGDRAEVWIVEQCRGVEVARHNARMIETIVWTTFPDYLPPALNSDAPGA